MQSLLCTEQWAGLDDVDHGAGVASDLLHLQREVPYLGLQAVQQRPLQVKKGTGLGVVILQLMNTLLQGRVHTVPLLALRQTHTHTQTHTRICIYIYTHTHTHTHTQTQTQRKIERETYRVI